MATTKNNSRSSNKKATSDSTTTNSSSSSSNKQNNKNKTRKNEENDATITTNMDEFKDTSYLLKEPIQEEELSEFEKQTLKELKGIRKSLKSILKFMKKKNT